MKRTSKQLSFFQIEVIWNNKFTCEQKSGKVSLLTSFPHMQLSTTIDEIFAGGIEHLAAEGHRSGIFKRRIGGRVRVDTGGIVGDEHADLRVHGGPEKAVHQFGTENYSKIAEAFPEARWLLQPGSLGENFAALKLTDSNVHIGDIFRVGAVLLQVSQPRSPCWKINHRFNIEQMSQYIASHRITGWYYRVLEPGFVERGNALTLIERQTDRFSIDEFWKVQLLHRPEVDDLFALARISGLTLDWKKRLLERATWIMKMNIESKRASMVPLNSSADAAGDPLR